MGTIYHVTRMATSTEINMRNYRTEINMRNYRSLPYDLIPNQFLTKHFGKCVLPPWKFASELKKPCVATNSRFKVEQSTKSILEHGCRPLTITFSDEVDTQLLAEHFPHANARLTLFGTDKPAGEKDWLHAKNLWLEAVCKEFNTEEKWEGVHKILLHFEETDHGRWQWPIANDDGPTEYDPDDPGRYVTAHVSKLDDTYHVPYHIWQCYEWYRFEFFRRNEKGNFESFRDQPSKKFLLPVLSSDPTTHNLRSTTAFAVKKRIVHEFVSLFKLTKSEQKSVNVYGNVYGYSKKIRSPWQTAEDEDLEESDTSNKQTICQSEQLHHQIQVPVNFDTSLLKLRRGESVYWFTGKEPEQDSTYLSMCTQSDSKIFTLSIEEWCIPELED